MEFLHLLDPAVVFVPLSRDRSFSLADARRNTRLQRDNVASEVPEL